MAALTWARAGVRDRPVTPSLSAPHAATPGPFCRARDYTRCLAVSLTPNLPTQTPGVPPTSLPGPRAPWVPWLPPHPSSAFHQNRKARDGLASTSSVDGVIRSSQLVPPPFKLLRVETLANMSFPSSTTSDAGDMAVFRAS